MPKEIVNGVELAYEVHGAGVPFVLLHCWAGGKALFQEQIPQFSKNYQVITLDLRGHGESEKPQTEYRLDVFAADVKALLDLLNLKQAIVLGHSMGGYIAQVFALTYPDRVKALILYGTVSMHPPIGHLWGPGEQESIRKIVEMGFREYIKWYAPQYWFSPEIDPELIDWCCEEVCFKVPEYAATAMWRELAKFSVRGRLSEIKVPTLLIVGDNDCRTPLEDHENMNRAIPNACLKIIKGTGHMAHIEKAGEFNKAVLNFLSNIE